jgi:Aromatic ring hydroxylase
MSKFWITIKLFRLAFDAAVSSFAGRQQPYERYYTGDPVARWRTLHPVWEERTHGTDLGDTR